MATQTPIQDPNTPKFDAVTGQPTDYGKSLGLVSPYAGTTAPITSDNLNNTGTSLTLPKSTTPTFGGLDTSMATTSSLIASEQKKSDASAVNLSDLYSQLTGVNTDLGNISSSVDTTALDAASAEKRRLSAELLSEQQTSRKTIEELQKNNPEGLFGGALTQEVNRINKESLSKQSDIAVLKYVADNDYAGAKEIVDRQKQMNLEQLTAQSNNLKLFIDLNKEQFTTAEQNLFNLKSKEIDNALAKQTKAEDAIANIKLTAVQNGAGASVLAALSAVDTTKPGALDAALKAVGSYLTSPKEKLELQKLRGDISKQQLELAAAKLTLGGSTGDAVQDIILGSSKYGDKNLVGAQLEQVQKASIALGSMESLQALLMQGKDGLKTTGPVAGRTRTLLSQLGGDADARAINATIQGLIPTVARGIFGEVGVLTDADIDNYRKTVPNLNSTEAQNKLVSIIMYDVLSRSLASTLTTNAMNQTNVSNFNSLYLDARNRINILKSELGVVETIPIDPVNQAKLDGAWNSTFSTTNFTNSLNSFFINPN